MVVENGRDMVSRKNRGVGGLLLKVLSFTGSCIVTPHIVNVTNKKLPRKAQSLSSKDLSFISIQHNILPHETLKQDFERFKEEHLDTQMQNIPNRAKMIV